MQLIYANRPGTPIAVVREITPAETDALRRYAFGESSRASAELLKSAWDHRWWFACPCRGKGAKPPLLYVHRSYLGQFSLAQMTDRPAHVRDCPFGQRVRTLTPDQEDDVPMPPLGDLLVRWFTAAKLNLVYPYSAQDIVTKQYASLREVSRSLHIGPRRTLYEFSRTHPDGLPDLIAKLRTTATRPANSDDDNDHWGVLLLVVDTIEEGSIPVGDHKVRLAPGQIRMPTGALEAGGPFAVLLKYALSDSGEVPPVELFAHPVLSARHLVPLDYAHERRTLKTLLKLQQKMLVEKDVLIVIRKTLPGTQAHDRGIAFQLNRLGPNGKPAREVDVLTIDATHLLERLPAESQPDDIVYHLVKQDVAFHDLDKKFYGILFARLLDGVSIASRSASTATDSSQPATVST